MQMIRHSMATKCVSVVCWDSATIWYRFFQFYIGGKKSRDPPSDVDQYQQSQIYFPIQRAYVRDTSQL
jgi:hypothetical protein